MSVYEIKPGEGTEWVEPVDGNFDRYRDAAAKPQSNDWRKPEFRFIRHEPGGVSLVPVDMPWFSYGLLPLRERAYSFLKDLLAAHGEFHPVSTTEGDVWIYNCLTRLDALDEDASDLKRFPAGAIMMLKRPVLKAEALGHSTAFRLSSMRVSPVFVREEVAQVISNELLTGWTLSPAAVSP